MKKFNLLFLLFFVFCLITACGETAKYLRNEKSRTTDEFLVKKKEPLSQPPDFETLPGPDSMKNKKDIKNKNLEGILDVQITESSKSGSTSNEESILKQIRK